MSKYKYGTLTSTGSFSYAPRDFESYSNFNLQEGLMLDAGFLPFVPAENKKNLPISKYIIGEGKISVTFTNLDGEEETRETEFITQEYLDYEISYYQSQKKSEINSAKLSRLNMGAPFKYGNTVGSKTYHVQLDADGKSNILGIKAKVMDGKYDKPSARILFKTYENEVLELTKMQFINMADIAFNYSEYVVFEKEKLFKMIDECITKEQINLITWEDQPIPSI